jgi:hypothetical protein
LTAARCGSLLILSVLTTIGAAEVLGQGEQQGTLTINLTNTRGVNLLQGKLSVKSSNNRLVYEGEATGQVTVRLPYGRYVVTYEDRVFSSVEREVLIDKSDSFVELAAAFVPEGGTHPSSISIKVVPETSCLSDGFLWVKLVGVFSQDTAERRVSSRGYALFEPVEDGAYVIVVVDGTNVRATLPVVTTRQLVTATITLAPCTTK